MNALAMKTNTTERTLGACALVGFFLSDGYNNSTAVY
jgi:hypothetical protein